MQQEERQVEHLAAHAAEAHEQPAAVVAAHQRAAAAHVLPADDGQTVFSVKVMVGQGRITLP